MALTIGFFFMSNLEFVGASSATLKVFAADPAHRPDCSTIRGWNMKFGGNNASACPETGGESCSAMGENWPVRRS